MADDGGRIAIGIVGLNFGSWIARTQILQGPGAPFFELKAVCDIDAGRAGTLARETGTRAYTSLEGLLGDADVRVVGLFTGPAGRAGMLRSIISAGRDVMTTKPFELDSREADSALRVAAAAGRLVWLNSPSPELSPDLAAIRSWEAAGLGRPVGCRADVWCSYREKPDGSWYDDPERCPAAPLFRLGIYLVNDLVTLLGPVAEVQVMHTRLFTGRPTPDNAQVALRFANGALGTIYASFCVDDGQPYRNTLVLNYERGTVYRNVGAFRPGEKIEGCRLSLVERAPDGGFRQEERELPAMSGDYPWAGFHDAIRSRTQPGDAFRATVVDAVAVVEAMRRAQASGRTEAVGGA